MKFSWDDNKAAANIRSHKVAFDEATEVFADANMVGKLDANHSTIKEKRYNAIGFSSRRLLFVVYTQPDQDTVHIISARKATKKEEKIYVQAKS